MEWTPFGGQLGLRQSRSGSGEQVVWDAALSGAWRFYTQDPWGNRIELLV